MEFVLLLQAQWLKCLLQEHIYVQTPSILENPTCVAPNNKQPISGKNRAKKIQGACRLGRLATRQVRGSVGEPEVERSRRR